MQMSVQELKIGPRYSSTQCAVLISMWPLECGGALMLLPRVCFLMQAFLHKGSPASRVDKVVISDERDDIPQLEFRDFGRRYS
jgi:hypothetical protein